MARWQCIEFVHSLPFTITHFFFSQNNRVNETLRVVPLFLLLLNPNPKILLNMSSKRYSLGTVSSLLSLGNVASLIRGCSNTLRTVCNATERWDSRFSGGYIADDSLTYLQNAGSVDGDFGQSNMKMKHKAVVSVDNSRVFNMIPKAFVGKHNWRQDYGQKVQGNQKGKLTQKIGQSQQSPKYYCTRSNETVEQYKGTLEELDSFCMDGKVKEAVEVLQVLEKLHIPVDLHCCLQLMHQCEKAKSLEQAKVVHGYALQHLSPLRVSTYNRILEMYFECDSVDDALEVFKIMPEYDLTTWRTMIMQLVKKGFAQDSMNIFNRFKELGLKPDGEMFIWVFVACDMLGDIKEAMLQFVSMAKDYGIVPTVTHCASLVDMMGEHGLLNEAFEMIVIISLDDEHWESISLESRVKLWESLINSCKIHLNFELEDRCAKEVQKLKKEKKFREAVTSHRYHSMIFFLLINLRHQMRGTESALDKILQHSVLQAVAYRLIISSARSTIKILKTSCCLCATCHAALKIISKLAGREIIVTGPPSFHHFKDGVCSCRV